MLGFGGNFGDLTITGIFLVIEVIENTLAALGSLLQFHTKGCIYMLMILVNPSVAVIIKLRACSHLYIFGLVKSWERSIIVISK